MAKLAYPSRLIGHDSALLSGGAVGNVHGVLHGARDFRNPRETLGVIVDRVMYKASPTAPEVPFSNGRVLVLRQLDGAKVWEGYSDAQGNYKATGLEVDADYIVVGVDPYKEHKATAAGPVTARREAA